MLPSGLRLHATRALVVDEQHVDASDGVRCGLARVGIESVVALVVSLLLLVRCGLAIKPAFAVSGRHIASVAVGPYLLFVARRSFRRAP